MHNTGDTSKLPPVHVLMPTYNCEKFLHKSLGSVLEQSYAPFVIAYNDGSTDQSQKILEDYYKQSPDRLRIIESVNNQGVSYARKALLSASQKTNPNALILWLDADDRYTDLYFVEKFAQCMKNTGADLCLFNYAVVFDNSSQMDNAKGLIRKKKGHEELLDRINKQEGKSAHPSEIEGILDVSTLGCTKGYAPISWPEPHSLPFEDIVYIAALLNSKKITAFPSKYRPIEYLRHAQSATGKRNAQTFTSIIKQLHCMLDHLQEEILERYKKELDSVVKL